MLNIYANNYKDYWSEEGRKVRLYLYDTCKGFPAQYCIGAGRAHVQQALDETWRGYVDGNLVAYNNECNINRVLIRTYKKYLKINNDGNK